MGSRENLTKVHKALHEVSIEKHVCSEFGEKSISKEQFCAEEGHNLIDSKVDNTSEPNGCLGFSRDDNAGCVSSTDVMETFADVRDGMKGDCENGVSFGLENLVEDQCTGCSNGSWCEIDVCKVETDGLHSKKEGCVGEYRSVHSSEGSEMPLAVIPVMDSLSICLKKEEWIDNKNICGSSEEGVMEVRSDVMAGIESDTCDQMLPSQGREIPFELIPVAGLPIDYAQQDEQKNDKNIIGSSIQGVTEDIEEKVDVLAEIDKYTCGQLLPSQGSNMPSELTSMAGSPSICVKQDELKDDVSISAPSLHGISEVMKERCDILTKMRTDNCHEILPSWNCESLPAELINLIGLPGNCVQNYKKRGDKTINSLSVEGVTEYRSDIVTGIETDTCNQLLPAQGIELLLDSVSMTSTPTNCSQKKGLKDSNSVCGPIIEEKGDALGAVEADIYNRISSSQGGEMPLKLHMTDVVSRCDRENDEKDDKSVCHLFADSSTDILGTKSNIDTFIQVLPSKVCSRDLEKLHEADLPSNSSQKNEQRDNKNVAGPFIESVMENLEEKSDVTTDLRAETCTQMLPIEENACNSKEGSSDNGSSGRLDAPDLSGKDVGDFISCSSTVDCFRLTDNEGKHKVRVDYVSETKCPDTVMSYSQRSSRKSKLSQKTRTKRIVGNSRKAAKMHQSQESMEFIFKASRRKRSCFSKPARSSMWGLSGSITQFFWQSNELGFNQVENQGSRKSRGGQGSGKGNKNPVSGSSQGSSRENRSSTSCLRLKVKIGKAIGQSTLNISVPEVVDISSSVDAIISDNGTELYQGTNFKIPKLANGVEDKLGKEGTEGQFHLNRNPDKAMTCLDPGDSVMDVKLEKKDLDSAFSGNSAADDDIGLASNIVAEAPQGATENMYMDPGTSPDSEVINSVPDAQVGARHQEDLHNAVLTTSKTFASRTDAISGKKGKKKGKKKNSHPGTDSSVLEDTSPATASLNKRKQSKKHRGRQKMENGFYCNEILLSTCAKASTNTSSSEEVSIEPLPLSELGLSGEGLNVESGIEAKTCCKPDVGLTFSELQSSKDFLPPTESKGLPSTKSKGHQLSKSSKSGKVGMESSEFSDSAKSRKGNASRHKGNQRKSVNKSKVKEKDACDQAADRVECYPETGYHIADRIGKTSTGNNITSAGVANLEVVSGGTVEQHIFPDNAWVLCDDCHKWRRIAVTLAKSIETCRWTCKDNLDEAFADCSVPQEKSNADINAELNISDEDAYDGYLNYKGVEKGVECKRLPVSQKARFKGINSNEFLHRSHRTQTIDEIMVCHCKPPSDGQLGCGDECLNRMLNIECVQGTCPCGDLCSNQQFQQHKYTKLEWFRSGKKGYGLRVLEDVWKGQFLIEYVGEVLDMQAYEARQKDYAAKGQKHFYFMTLNGSEVIDAGVKGNLGRFINHSCDPNCRTEKWMVNGEICIGVFAMKDIKKLQEVTFDYNYVRVFGAAAKKCYCDSPQCRGYIGGDPLNTEVIVQGDSDEEYPEPVMFEDDGTRGGMEKITFRTSSYDGQKVQMEINVTKDSERMNNSRTTVRQPNITTKIEDSMDRPASAISQLPSSVETGDSEGKSLSPLQEVSLQTEDVTSKSIAAVQQDISVEEETPNKSSFSVQILETDGFDDNKEDKRVVPKSRPRMKSSRSSGSVKKGKGSSNPPDGNKIQMTIANQSQVLSTKPKKLTEGSSSGRIDTVEEKLNELLDADGGISKRKDAPKGYLKLLLLTAASGGSASSEAIQSNRDLSMILDALLKTKSRAVLVDIINKNGLRMLHNIMKQYRRDFKKIPILRKLLKVLEYLAAREILTLEHINGGPPCPGMERFRDSILSLTEHDDKQVHQIARNFRDRWIPRPFRKITYMDKDEGRMEYHRGSNCSRVSASHNHRHDQGIRPTEAIDSVMQSKVMPTSVNAADHEGCSERCISVCLSNGSKIRKRKSRWDQPAETNPHSRSLQNKEQKIESRLTQQFESSMLAISGEVLDHIDKVSRENNGSDCHQSSSRHDEAVSADSGRQNSQEDVPPGFSSPLPLVSSNNVCDLKCPSDVVLAHPQEKFLSRLPVSYGIPLTIMQQCGLPHAEISESWVIAPGMPFHPFPPLPPFPREKKDPSGSSAVNSLAINEHKEEVQWHGCGPSTCQVEISPSTTVANQLDVDIPGANTESVFKRTRGSSYNLGRRYFRQQKWSTPPWFRNGWGNMGDSLKGGTGSIDVGNITTELRNPYFSQDVSTRVENSGYNSYQHQKH